jgi:dipeptidyl aminopeptidase/acylaminoacyl peptidase
MRLRPLLALLLLLAAPFVQAERLPVGQFFKDPEFNSVSLSPTGEYITVSVPQGDRTVLAAFKVDGMKLVGKWDYGSTQHIDRVQWVNDERFFMYVTKKLGRYDFRVGTPDVYASNVDGSERIDIPNGGFYSIVSFTWDDPKSILVSRSVDTAFLFKLDVYTGKTRTVATAPLRFGNFVVDSKYDVRYAVGQKEEGIEAVTLRKDGDTWTQIHQTEMGGSVREPLGFDRGDKNVYFRVSDEGEPTRLVLADPATREEQVLASNPNVDLGNFLVSSDHKEILAVGFQDGLPGYDFVNTEHPESKAYAGLIKAFPNHAVRFAGISHNGGRYILVGAYSDVEPARFFLFDRDKGQAKFLLAAADWIDPKKMSPMQPISLTARDGTKLHGYVTIPRDSNGKNLPLILHPHGGPHGPRDQWGFNPEVQFLANRGYAVLQVNFRGSGGYGNAFEKKGYRNWGTTMIDDMTDAVDHLVKQGIADGNRVCTYGASYGGYAALQSVVRNPTKYRCTIGYVGVYSLPLMFKDGDIPETESGQKFLARVMPSTLAEQRAQSAAFNADKIKIPVMLVQGGRDVRVPPTQYRALKKALAEVGNSPEIDILEPKEAHGFYDYDNQVELYTAMEKFLDKHIGPSAKTAAN